MSSEAQNIHHKLMKPRIPSPCFRAMYDHTRETLYRTTAVGWLKKDENGILRCRGYIKAMNGSPASECEVCPFYFDTYSEFWTKRD